MQIQLMLKEIIIMIFLLSIPVTAFAFAPDLFESTTPSFDSDIIHVDEGFFTENNLDRYLVFGNDNSGLYKITVLNHESASSLESKGFRIVQDARLEFNAMPHAANTSISRIGNITGSTLSEQVYGVTGKGVTIAIVDTGVDFSNLDIRDSVARDKFNHPIMLDPDGQGIILTNNTFYANIDENQIIRNFSNQAKQKLETDNLQSISTIYVNNDGVFLNVEKGGAGTIISIYNAFFPNLGDSIVFNGTLDNDMKIGKNNRDYIQSKSGIYHVGVIYQQYNSITQVVPVIVVDSYKPGLYDTIYADMSTSWMDYTDSDSEFDFDFTDEKPLILGSGNEFLLYDSDSDGIDDYTAGAIGAKVLDVYGVLTQNSTIHDYFNAINGTLLPGLDEGGNFFGVMTDFAGHGTASASSITSKGEQLYDIYNDTNHHTITGVAPNAKIIPVKTLWYGDTIYGWLLAAGFENKDNFWNYTGDIHADVISNSWGFSTFPSFETSPGMDVLSLFLSMLATPHSLDDDYPGTVIVTSSGNSGHGYGTISMPATSPLGITVGATTNNVFVGYDHFAEQPRFGKNTTHYNDMVDFSSRGPSIIGDPKPDLVSIGAYGFVPSSFLPQNNQTFRLFGGTSMAAPLVSGMIALIIEDLKNQSHVYDPFLIKNILLSTATDLKNDPFTQGAGLGNVKSALDFLHANDTFIVYNDASYENIREILLPALKNIYSDDLGFERFSLPQIKFPMTSWFAGHLYAGERSDATFTIENPTNKTIYIDVNPTIVSLIDTVSVDSSTVPHQQDSILNETGVYAPNYIKLSNVQDHSMLKDYFTDYMIPAESDLLVLNVNFAFDQFLNDTTLVYADDLMISSLYLYDWVDRNNDTKIASDELNLVNRAGSWGTVQELRVSDPHDRFEGVPLVGVYPVPTRYSYWDGDTKVNSTSLDYTLSASYYKKEKWTALWPQYKTKAILPYQSAQLPVSLIVPDDMQTGLYQGFLSFSSKDHTVNAPVSFAVKEAIVENQRLLVSGVAGNDIMYGNGYTKGAFDMVNRFMSGDWRQYYLDIQDDSINTAAIQFSWESANTNLAVFVMDPLGRIVQTNMPTGVFGQFVGWPSLDWLGTSEFSEGGGFYPVKNKDDYSTVLYVPVNQTGVYSILTHTTLYGGENKTEPITLSAIFSDIPTVPVVANVIPVNDTVRVVNDTVREFVNDVIHVDDSAEMPPDNTLTFGSGITIGIISGIVIGVIVGIVLVVSWRKAVKSAVNPQ